MDLEVFQKVRKKLIIALIFNENDPNIKEVANIIRFYKESLDKIKVYGP